MFRVGDLISKQVENQATLQCSIIVQQLIVINWVWSFQ